MRRSWSRLVLGTVALGSAFVLGCSHHTRSCPSCGSSSVAAGPTPGPSGDATRVVAANQNGAKPDVARTSSYHPTPVTPAPVLAAPAQPAPASALDEMLKTAAKADVQPAKVASSSEAKGEWQILAGKAEREGTVRRRTFTDITVKPCFAHAPDYAWLVGELLKEGEAWIVHYASVDEEKGDSVLLVNVPEMSAFKDGQVVRVEGQMVESSRGGRPEYRVQAVHPLDNP